MQQNQMQLNKSKTKIIFHRSNNSYQSLVDTIENVDSTKLLGVLLSDELKWNIHIDIHVDYFYYYVVYSISISINVFSI